MLTVASIEAAMVGQYGRMKVVFQKVGMDYTTVNGANADLQEPIALAVLRSGFSVTNYPYALDIDVIQITGSSIVRFMDIVELQCWSKAMGRWAQVEEQVGVERQAWQQFRDQLHSQIECMEERIRKPFAVGIGAPQVGEMTKGATVPHDPNFSNPVIWPGFFNAGF